MGENAPMVWPTQKPYLKANTLSQPEACMARKNQKKPKSRGSRPLPLPVLWTDMLAASMETIARRSLLIATGNFTLTEYQRMVCEKAKALQGTALAAAAGTPTLEA